MLPKSKVYDLIVRSEQINRIKHFMKNAQSDKIYTTKEDDSNEENKYESDNENEGNEDKIVKYNIKIKKDIQLDDEQLEKLKFFHVFMFSTIYASEGSFFKGLFSATWVFDRLFRNTLLAAKNSIINSGIFDKTDYYEDRRYMNKDLYMFTIPIIGEEIDYDTINS